ncbi:MULTISPECIES: DUF485 domain-containing protein [Paraburkholderia]|uniref:DUF485 domain-containing protein n=1 Tax=Paraburkholderia TaxID=1822464 RepID=UPI0038B79E1D
MNNLDMAERVSRHVLFKELVTRRAKLVRSLMAVGLVAYFILIALVAFRPQILRVSVAQGTSTTVGVVLAVAILALGWIITWIYVHKANSTFDRLSAHLLEEVAR